MPLIKAIVLPQKTLSDGRNKVRLSLSHNGMTRYIVTDIIINSQSEFKNGSVVRRPDAPVLNSRIRKLLTMYQERIDNTEYVNSMTCQELLEYIKNERDKENFSLEDVFNSYISTAGIKESSKRVYNGSWVSIKKYINPMMPMEKITPRFLLELQAKLRKSNLSETTVTNYMSILKILTYHAIRYDMAHFAKNPWLFIKLSSPAVRENWIDVSDVKNIRDMEIEKKNLQLWRNFFMLSFYLGGINMADIIQLDLDLVLKKKVVVYKRMKAEGMTRNAHKIEFTIPDEAINMIKWIKDYLTEVNKKNINSFIKRHTVKMRELTNINNLTFYSARKAFSQIASQIGIQTFVIEHILGHSNKPSRSVFFHYAYVTPQMATDAIRKVLDYIK